MTSNLQSSAPASQVCDYRLIPWLHSCSCLVQFFFLLIIVLFFKKYFCVCMCMYVCIGVLVHTCAHTHTNMHAYVHTYIHGGHSSIWSVFFILFWDRICHWVWSSLIPLDLLARQVPKTLPFLPSQCWDNRFILPNKQTNKQPKDTGDPNSVPCLNNLSTPISLTALFVCFFKVQPHVSQAGFKVYAAEDVLEFPPLLPTALQ